MNPDAKVAEFWPEEWRYALARAHVAWARRYAPWLLQPEERD